METISAQDGSPMIDPKQLPKLDLPKGVTSRFVDTRNLNFHVLESLPPSASASDGSRPHLIVCVHGFPELAYSWRYVLPALAEKGYYAVAFDQRGYGRTHNPDLSGFKGDTFRPSSLIKDTISLVYALGYTSVATIVGHDFGAVTAMYCALSRPDIFQSLCLMSHPFKGIPSIELNTSPHPALPSASQPPKDDPYAATHDPDIHTSLARLSVPRKHYKWYYCTQPSSDEMLYPTGQPLSDFYRGYFHLKSGDWHGNADPYPHKLTSWTATELAKMPHYYIMPLHASMREAVAQDMAEVSGEELAKAQRWLPDKDLEVYVREVERVGWATSMNWYRIQTSVEAASDSILFVGKKVSVPTKFVVGKMDWGHYQEPGAVEAMEEGRSVVKVMYRGTVVVEGAGHWVNQEQPARCVEEICNLADEVRGKSG